MWQRRRSTPWGWTRKKICGGGKGWGGRAGSNKIFCRRFPLMNADQNNFGRLLPKKMPFSRICGSSAKICGEKSSGGQARPMAFGPGLSGGNAFGDWRVGMEQQFHQARRMAFTQVLPSEFFHGRDVRRNVG